MKVIHLALVCSSEGNSDRFYKEILGLNKIKSSIVPPNIINKISSKDEEIKVITYGNNELLLEIFIVDSLKAKKPELNHICLEVQDREGFINICSLHGLEPIKIVKGDTILIFITDYDNNLFEIKEKAR